MESCSKCKHGSPCNEFIKCWYPFPDWVERIDGDNKIPECSWERTARYCECYEEGR